MSILCALFLGLFLGFLFAPIKKGVNIEIKNNGMEYQDRGIHSMTSFLFSKATFYFKMINIIEMLILVKLIRIPIQEVTMKQLPC